MHDDLLFANSVVLLKGLFAKRRMFLITEGPAIYYVDPENMELKGTISWSVKKKFQENKIDVFLFCRTADLRIEQKDMKTFHIHVVNLVFYSIDFV